MPVVIYTLFITTEVTTFFYLFPDFIAMVKKKVKSSMARSLPVARSLPPSGVLLALSLTRTILHFDITECGVNYQLLAVMY